MNGRCYLKKSEDFSLVHSAGRWQSSKILTVKYLKNDLGYARWGIVASKKIGGAVTRNHVKRQIREIMRAQSLKPGFYIVILARQSITSESFSNIDRPISTILKKCDLLVD